MRSLFLAAALALTAAPALSQTPPAARAPQPASSGQAEPAALPDADPALWAVRDEDTTIYLFGTIHLLDGRPWFNDEVKAAFDSADELVVEAIIPDDPAEVAPLVLRYAVDPQGRKLSDRLTPEENAVLSQALAGLGGLAGAFDRLEPWYATVNLVAVASERLGISGAYGPEGVLIRAARARDMAVSELEGLEWQFQLFDEMPEEDQLAQLRQTLDSIDTLHESLTPMLAAWSTGDAEGLHDQLVAYGEEDPALQRLLFTDRNRTWAEWIRTRMERPGTLFVAVGAGHLAGNDSVQAVLREHGIETERVPHAEEPAASAP